MLSCINLVSHLICIVQSMALRMECLIQSRPTLSERVQLSLQSALLWCMSLCHWLVQSLWWNFQQEQKLSHCTTTLACYNTKCCCMSLLQIGNVTTVHHDACQHRVRHGIAAKKMVQSARWSQQYLGDWQSRLECIHSLRLASSCKRWLQKVCDYSLWFGDHASSLRRSIAWHGIA